jgi:tricorn protease-like protein/C-terminal processing protease CtpA/Prc
MIALTGRPPPPPLAATGGTPPMKHSFLARLPLALTLACGTLSAVSIADVTPHGSMVRYPDVSATHIVFTYANDLWTVPKAGGTATPLSSPPGGEAFPRFSPDGKTIAFVGNYEGNRDLYTIPAAGGTPTRVTYHSAAESLSDWAGPKFQGGDRLLYLTNGFAGLSRQSQLFTIPAGGGPGVQVPVPYAGFGAISPDGQWLAYSLHSTDNRTWKRYRGGMATDLWLYNLVDGSAKRITDWEGNDTLPMWVPGGDGSTVYYLSDQGPEHRMNIWAYTVATGAREQVTSYVDNDVRWPGVGPGDGGKGEIVFQLGSELRLLDLSTRKDRVVTVTIPGDRPALRPRTVDASKWMQGAAISPTGKRVVLGARGDLFSAPAKEGVTRNLTRSGGVYERDPAWSPDGRWIAYFSDATGEYELWVRPADAKAPEEKDDKKKDEAKKEEAKNEGDAKPAEVKPNEKPDEKPDEKAEGKAEGAKAAKPEPRKLTSLGAGFRSRIQWSPDSTMMAFTDNEGNLHLTTLETGETKRIDKDPWGNGVSVSWSHDSRWLAYSLSQDDRLANNQVVMLHDVKEGKRTQVTSPMFSSTSPTFDRKGDWLFFASSRIINAPTYGDLDTTFVYRDSEALYAVPLRADVKNPWAPKSDEEEWKKPEKKDEPKKDEGKKDEEKKGDDKPAGETKAAARVEDAITGTWVGQAAGNAEGMPAGGLPVTFKVMLNADGTLTGTIQSMMGGGAISDGKFDKATGQFSFVMAMGRVSVTFSGTVTGEEISGSWSVGQQQGSVTLKRTSKEPPEVAGKDGKDGGKEGSKDGGKDASKDVKIDLDGFEARAIQLPVPAGSFGRLAVTHDHKLIYGRQSTKGGSEGGGIRLFDLNDEKREEKTVLAGSTNFELSGDGKKLLLMRGNNAAIADASAGATATNVPTTGMSVTIQPREEWRQIVTETWRLFRDYFYEPTMHGVDWPKVKSHYLAMVDDASSREDVAFIQAELVSELNIGHAYITNPGDIENPVPSVNVGLLGCDFELVKGDAGSAYRIATIIKAAPWDADAKSPLAALGLGVKEGDFVLAVNGTPIDASKDIYAAFLGTADKVTQLTVGPNPVLDDKTRDVLVTPTASETGLRYRAWIEGKRAYAEAKSDGKVGYIYVPNTGIDGQNDLFRQFAGQRGKAALIIDDRWNGGGQIPTRFIELLNRPATNFWARRGANDWPWPPDAHFGPKAMLINGLAGSGGDMFPWLFRHNKLGKLFGTRTWGGLVGIQGYPELIDGGDVAVPSFGFYELDGTWGVEGHGVDPDVEVLDDPSKMAGGADPQLDAAIAHLLEEVKARSFTPPTRPASPNRAGMGLDPKDK